MGGGSGSGSHSDHGSFNSGGHNSGSGGDLMTEQMHTLLEMLRAAKADDMAALEVAESRALKNKEIMRRMVKEQKERRYNDYKYIKSDCSSGGGNGRPALETSDSVEIARAEKEAARSQRRAQQQQQQYEQHQYEEEDEESQHEIYPEEWEEDSRDMTRMGDSTDLTRATYEMAQTVDLEEARRSATGQIQGDANRSGLDSAASEKVPLKPPAPSKYDAPGPGGTGRSDEGSLFEDFKRRAQQSIGKLRVRSYRDTSAPLEPRRPNERVAESSNHGTGEGEVTDASEGDDWGERQAEAFLHNSRNDMGHQDDIMDMVEPEEEEDEVLSHHTREEMGPPMSLEDEGAYYTQALARERAADQYKYEARREDRKEQASSNVDADIQSRVLRQLEKDEDYDDDGKPYDDDDDDYYDSDESSEISDITSPTFATYMDPPTVCDDGSIISRGIRYAAGGRFAGMTAAQVAALANRRVNDRHRADGRSVSSEDENAQELERRLDTSGESGAGAVTGPAGVALHDSGEADKEQEPSLAPPSLAPPSMAGIGVGSGSNIQPPSSREIKRQQQELLETQQAAAAAEKEVQEQQARLLEQQQKNEEEKAQVEAAIAAAERQREENERLEAENRLKAQEEEEAALRKAEQEARDHLKERRERFRREIAERQEKQRRLEEERMQQQQMLGVIAEEVMQQQPVIAEEEDKDDDAPPLATNRSTSPTPPVRKERPAGKSARARPPPSQDPTRRPGQRPTAPPAGAKGNRPPSRRPSPRRTGQSAPSGARPGPPGPGRPVQRPDRARRQTSVPHGGQRPRAPRKPGEARKPDEARSGAAAPGDMNSRPMSSDKPEKNKWLSALGTLLKAKTKFKTGAANAQTNGGETSPQAFHSSRTARATGGAGTRQRASQRDPTRKSLLPSSAKPSSTGRRPAGGSSQRNRARSTRGMARAESAAWKQPLKEEHMEKKLNPNDDSNNLDVDNLMSNMGHDIDYIFRELSTFEGQQKKQGVEGTDLPANPSPRIGGSDSSDSDEQSLIATAKIKYTLGQLSSTLKQDEKRPRSSSNADPLLIDKDGFLIQEGIQPSPEDAFGPSSFADQPNDKNRRPKPSDLLAAKRKELQGYQSQQKLRQKILRRMSRGVKPDDERDNQTFATTEVEADVRNKVMALAAGKTGKNDNDGLFPSGVSGLGNNFSTIDYDGDDDLSKIDAVEEATRKRIEVLRRVVAEKAVQLSAAESKGGQGGAHHHLEDDELTTKLDFVEEETMKQISRLRKRYKSTSNAEN